MRTAVLLLLFAGGCGLSVVGVGVDADAGSVDGPPVVLPGPDATADVMVNDVAAPPIDALSDAATETGPVCVAASCEGKRCSSTGCDYFADCKALRDGFGGTTGTYPFRRAGAGDTFSAYCEMTLAGGGWTLVGRSAVNGTSTSFGWKSENGTLADESKPYSLNAVARGLPMSEVLAVRGTRAAPFAAYLITSPAGFPTGLGATAAAVQGRTKIVNPACMTNGDAPNMFGNMGHTDRTTFFFLRDFTGYDTYGFFPNGWRLNYSNDCNLAGDFHEEQGLLFVR